MSYRSRAVLLVILCLLVPAAGVSAGQAAVRTLYTRALASERTLRDGARTATLQQLRSAIDAYETIVRRYPGSGYSDNALWQAASLAILAYERFGRVADKRTAVRVLEQLRTGYPSSSLVSRVEEALQQAEAMQGPVLARALTRLGPLTAPPPATAVPTAAPVDAPKPAETPGIIAIRNILRTPLPDGIRVSIEMDDEASFHAERLVQPSRVFFDLKGARPVPALLDATLRFPGAIVREIRLGRHPQNTTRVVMDMEGAESYSVFTLYHPFRLVIDFKSAAAPPAMATREGLPPLLLPPSRPPASAPPAVPAPKPVVLAPAPPPAAAVKPAAARPVASLPAIPPALPAANSNGQFSLARQLGLGFSRIVIDAGHGGHDPGTQSHGINEAELVLDVALRLTRLIQKQTGIEVVMTRDTDTFVPLEERTAVANRQEADLFLSIHANASRDPKARGIETYFLNFASNPDAEAVAARENSASGRTMHSLPDIVRAIALNNKIDESRHFADLVQRSMVRRLSTRNKHLKDRGVKQAPFVVLIGAAMPSVLAEIAFLTHKQEGQLLKTGVYRQQIAESLLDAILRYQQSLKKMKTGASTVGAR